MTQPTNEGLLCLSAQRAFLGRIHPEMRLIKIKFAGSRIRLTVILGSPPNFKVSEDISEAASEIIADFPEAQKVEEFVVVIPGALPKENLIEEGWIYKSAE
jgi:hypothetical protein